jgi:Oxysterol-binding protein
LEEKKRLEEKQRIQRKEREEKDVLWQPRWFKEEIDEITDSKTYIYKGGYWEQREMRKFEESMDLF